MPWVSLPIKTRNTARLCFVRFRSMAERAAFSRTFLSTVTVDRVHSSVMPVELVRDSHR